MPAPDLSLFAIPGLPLVKPGDDLGVMIAEALTREGLRPQDGDLLVIAQKIVSKAEGRAVALDSVEPSEPRRHRSRASTRLRAGERRHRSFEHRFR